VPRARLAFDLRRLPASRHWRLSAHGSRLARLELCGTDPLYPSAASAWMLGVHTRSRSRLREEG